VIQDKIDFRDVMQETIVKARLFCYKVNSTLFSRAKWMSENNLSDFNNAASIIKDAIVRSRYQAAKLVNEAPPRQAAGYL